MLGSSEDFMSVVASWFWSMNDDIFDKTLLSFRYNPNSSVDLLDEAMSLSDKGWVLTLIFFKVFQTIGELINEGCCEISTKDN